MGSRSSSTSRGGSGEPPDGTRQPGGGEENEEENVDLAQVLAYLLRRGQVRLVQGGGAASLQLVQALSDSEDDDSAWEGRLGDRYTPTEPPVIWHHPLRILARAATTSDDRRKRIPDLRPKPDPFPSAVLGGGPGIPWRSPIKGSPGLNTHSTLGGTSRHSSHHSSTAVDSAPDTMLLDQSEIKTQVLLAAGKLGCGPHFSIPRLLLQREKGRCRNSSFSAGERSQMSSHFLPNHLSFTDSYTQKAFCGIYAESGDLFMSACQDQYIRLYDCRYGRFKKFKTVKARDVGWSVLDVAFTPDGAHFLYSSWSDYIHICNIYGDCNTHTALDLNPSERRFAVFSITVSSDGREVLGGANDGCLYVYDREQNLRTLKVESHEDDVNAVAFADASSHILFSGGDDALLKVWDRRTMREDDPQPVGVLAGHQDGITFIDSKGDARYLISNSKDQTVKLWDIRRFSGQAALEASRRAVVQQNWDYRWQQVPKKALRRHRLTGDTSLMTYRGHGVLHTLIRCRFSPSFTTAQQYIYCGCSTGKVVVYDLLTGKLVKRLTSHRACVRDVSWHPYQEKIVSSSWDGNVHLWDYRQAEYHEDDLQDPSQKWPTFVDDSRQHR